MPTSKPFIEHATGGLDTDQIRAEAYPLAGLVALVGGLALIAFLFVVLVGGNGPLGVLFTIVTEFVLAVGIGIVLMYVIARGIQLTDAEETALE